MLGGCAESFAALYDRRQGGVYRFALRMTGSEAEVIALCHLQEMNYAEAAEVVSC